MTPLKLPPPSQIRLPLLEALREHEGLSAGDAADRVAEKLHLDAEVTSARIQLPNGDTGSPN